MVFFEDVCKRDLDLIVDEIYEGGNEGNLSDEVTSSNSRKRVRFLGLAVSEDYHLGKDESLIATWRTSDEKGCNYRVAA